MLIFITLANCYSVNCQNVLTTIAGTGTASSTGDGGAATAATINQPAFVVRDASGNLYWGENNRIRKITISTGFISTYLNGLGSIRGLAFYNSELYFAEASGTNAHTIRKYNGTTTTLVAGTPGTASTTTTAANGDGGAATSATLNTPSGITIDASGNLFIADRNNHKIRMVNLGTGIISTILGTGTAGSGNAAANNVPGSASAAKIASPNDVKLDLSGNLYVALNVNACILKVTNPSSSGTVAVVAGLYGTSANTGNGGLATSARLSAPYGLIFDNAGAYYILDGTSNLIRKVGTDGLINAYGGGTSGTGAYGGDGGSATATGSVFFNFNAACSGVFDNNGFLYVGDRGNSRIRKIGPAEWKGTTSDFSTTTNWTATAGPSGFNIYVPSTTNNPILSSAITIIGGIISTGATLTISPSGTLTNNGILTNNGNLILKSDVSGTASIGNSTGTITGNITVERYIPFQRGYRTFGHPFTTGQSLGGLNSVFAITGSGTGFNSSSSSSIFRYDSSAASGSALVGISNSPNSTSSVVWGAGQGLYALVRGSGTQGINFNYTGGKTAATASYTGTINQGALADYALGTANYTLVGNPYPSAINIKNVNSNGGTALSGNTNVYSTIYVYNPYKNAGGDTVLRGGFDAYINNGTNDIIIPSGGAFYVKAITGGQVLKFTEASKSTSTSLSVFGEGTGTPSLKVGIESNKGSWDDVMINLYSNGTSRSTDRYDGTKLSNQLFDLYSLSSDGKKLCIDSRSNNLSSEQIIPLGIRTNEVGTDFKFTVQQNSLPSNAKVVLRDKLLQQEVVLDKDFTGYTFAMSNDTATKGNNRFELVINGTAASIVVTPQDQAAIVSFNASPNPFRDVVTVSLDKAVTTSTRVSVLNMLGQSVQSKVVAAGTSNVQFSLSGESAGTYFVRVSTEKGEYTHKIVKQ